jgi:hypothetical protein
MATLRVAEFAGLGRTDQSDSTTILPVPPTVEQSVTVSASGVVIGQPFQLTTKFVELCTDTTCSIQFGIFSALTTATVTTGNGRLNANERVIRAVPNTPPGSTRNGNAEPTVVQYGLVVIVAT